MEASSSKEPGVEIKPKAQIWYLQEIEDFLSGANMCNVRDSCFGHLFDISEILFQGELFKLLCFRLQSSSLEKNTLTFNFGEHSMEFGCADFCLMTGLKYSGNACLPKFSKFHGTVFPRRKELFFVDIEKEFQKECEQKQGNSLRSLKLAYLLLIYGLLVNNDPDKGILDLGYLHLMEEVNNINDFPWGLVAYDYLVKSTHRLKLELAPFEDDNRSHILIAYGFVYPLQCWAYEVLPALGTFCGSLHPERLTTFPRMLKWSATRIFTAKDEGLRNFFLADQGCNPVRISLTSNETRKLVELGIASSMHVASPLPCVDSTKHVGRRLDFGSVKREDSKTKKRACKRKVSTNGASPMSSRYAKCKNMPDCSIIEATEFTNSMSKTRTKRQSGTRIPNVTPRSDSYSNTNFVTPEHGSSRVDQIYKDISLLVLNLKGQMKCLEEYISMKFRVFELLLNERRSVSGCACNIKVRGTNEVNFGPNIVTDVGCTKNISEVNLMDREMEPLFKNCEPTDGLSKLLFDPNDEDMLYAELQPYISWTETPKTSTSENQVLLPTEILQYADLPWFNALWRHDGWLDNTHIDALVNLLIFRYDKQFSVRDWTCMEVSCWQVLTGSDMVDILPVVLPYVRGERPFMGGIKWGDVNHLFGVANINQSHWVFYDVSLEDQVITVYNSVVQDWDIILLHFANVCRNIPLLCRLGDVWESSSLRRKPLKDFWNVVNYPRPPLQINQSDCGVMALKYMECCAYKVSVNEIVPGRCERSRRRYCAKLFELGKQLKENVEK